MKMRFRFSLKMALVLLTLVSLWFGYQSMVASQRRAAVKAVREVESSISKPDAPKYLVNLFGEEYFCKIETVRGLCRKLADKHLAAIAKVPELKHVSNNHAWAGSQIATFQVSAGASATGQGGLISDEGIRHLSKASNLESLILWNTIVTDEGMAHLAKLKKLRLLMIASPKITDESIEHLSQIKTLERFWVSGRLSQAGVARLTRALPDCEITPMEK